MKVESTESSVKLVPETDWEREQIKRLRQRCIKKVEFEDDWNGLGPLIISFSTPSEDWGT